MSGKPEVSVLMLFHIIAYTGKHEVLGDMSWSLLWDSCSWKRSLLCQIWFLVGKVVGRAFPVAAGVWWPRQPLWCHNWSTPRLELARAEVLVIYCAVVKDLWPFCYMGLHGNGCHWPFCCMGLHGNGCHFVDLERGIIMRTNFSWFYPGFLSPAQFILIPWLLNISWVFSIMVGGN